MAKYRIDLCDCEQCQAGRVARIVIYKDGERLVSFASELDGRCFLRLGCQDEYHVITIPTSEDELLEAFTELVRNKLVDLGN